MGLPQFSIPLPLTASPPRRIRMNITGRTTVQLGAVLVAAVAAGGLLWQGAQLVEATRAALVEHTKQIAALDKEKYSLTAASEQACRMAIENPGMRVPDPRDPSRVIVVNFSRTLPAGSPAQP